jgi:cytochrome P450
MGVASVVYDPYDHALHRDPYPTYRRLREEAPVHHNAALRFWTLSRFDDVAEAFRDWQTYTSTRGVALHEVGDVLSMIQMDPPAQVALRNLVSRGFTLRRVSAMEPRIRQLARLYLAPLLERESCDLVADFAALLPSDVISTLLGVPRADHAEVRARTEALMARDALTHRPPPSAEQAALQQVDYFIRLIAEKRRAPGDDLISALCAAELEGRRLADHEILGFSFLLISGGNETTEKLIANTVYLLQRHPAQRQRLYADPGLIPRAVEESLRYLSPTQYMVRATTRDVELYGRRIPRAAQVVLLIGAANRDERQFPDPDRFDLERDAERHLAFGYGVHFCLGASLARLEARVALEEIHCSLAEYQVDESRLDFIHAGNVAGFSTLPLAYRPLKTSSPKRAG